ncbi:MipA/OmpV family protein [Neptunicella sp. SCSIO 80796]|uniref:MipA/OmpV family protein n=1 Tax=Neptunicella plasticusilytica TaxID=3117012 RepID=UPI003A4D9F8B
MSCIKASVMLAALPVVELILKKLLSTILLCGLLITSLTGYACELADQHCVPQRSWQIAVAVGAGVKLNPLYGGDNIPLVVLPDIAWYGESAYFDNGELGYQWIQDNPLSLETFVAVNTEKAYFSFWHPANVLFSNMELSSSFSPSQEPKRRVDFDDAAHRDWALDAGLRAHWITRSGEWRLAVLTDVTNTYNGQHLDVNYQHAWQINQWTLSTTLGLQWKSRQLLNYYYGLGDRDNVGDGFQYQAGSGWFPSIGLLARRPISERWSWIMRANYQHLPESMRNSPLVERNNVVSGFIGAAYQF